MEFVYSPTNNKELTFVVFVSEFHPKLHLANVNRVDTWPLDVVLTEQSKLITEAVHTKMTTEISLIYRAGWPMNMIMWLRWQINV